MDKYYGAYRRGAPAIIYRGCFTNYGGFGRSGIFLYALNDDSCWFISTRRVNSVIFVTFQNTSFRLGRQCECNYVVLFLWREEDDLGWFYNEILRPGFDMYWFEGIPRGLVSRNVGETMQRHEFGWFCRRGFVVLYFEKNNRDALFKKTYSTWTVRKRAWSIRRRSWSIRCSP